MERFLTARAADKRFANERRVTMESTSWYSTQKYTFSASQHKSESNTHTMTPHKGDDSPKKKKRKRKSGEAFSEAKKKKLENRTSSDDSDSGPCWSDYERTPNTKAGEKGSCRPKGGGKK